jgi:hypothetical protein
MRFCFFSIAILVTFSNAIAAGGCLSKKELLNVARMGATMGVGGALNRCGHCLADRYQPTVQAYEASGMLAEFRRSESELPRDPAKADYADDLVRMSARAYANDMTADCAACEKLAGTIASLSAEEGRASFYKQRADALTKMPAFRRCPEGQ